jgi:hypothetical protein
MTTTATGQRTKAARPVPAGRGIGTGATIVAPHIRKIAVESPAEGPNSSPDDQIKAATGTGRPTKPAAGSCVRL